VNVSLDHPVTPNRVIGSPRGLRNTCRFRNLLAYVSAIFGVTTPETVIIAFGGHSCSRSSICSHFTGFAREAPSPGKTCRESCDESFLGEVDFYRLSAGETADA
jgi:hypothetical protein